MAPDARLQLLERTANGATEALTYGLLDGDEPLAILLAKRERASPDALQLTSLLVAEAHRGRGLGSRALAEVEGLARAEGVQRLEVFLDAASPALPIATRMLERRGFARPIPGMVLCRAGASVMAAPWMSISPPPGDTLVALASVGAGPIARARSRGDVPPALDPAPPHPYEPLNSLALLRDGELVAWLVTHRLDARTIRYSRLFVLPERRAQPRGVALVAEGIRRQVEGGVLHGSFVVASENAAMIRFVRRRMTPWLDAITETIFAAKPL